MGLFAVSYYYGRHVNMSDQLSLYDKIRNTSAIVFGVMGAWIAVVYPESLQDILSIKTRYSSKYTLSKILASMRISSIVLITIIVIDFLNPIIKQIIFLHKYKEVFRGLSYCLLCLLFLFQGWSIILTLLPANEAEKTVNKASKTRDLGDKLFKK